MRKIVIVSLLLMALCIAGIKGLEDAEAYTYTNILLVTPSSGASYSSSPIMLEVKITDSSGSIVGGAEVNFYMDRMYVGAASTGSGINLQKLGLNLFGGLASVSVSPNYGYHYWYVTATLPDGTQLSSSVWTFSFYPNPPAPPQQYQPYQPYPPSYPPYQPYPPYPPPHQPYPPYPYPPHY